MDSQRDSPDGPCRKKQRRADLTLGTGCSGLDVVRVALHNCGFVVDQIFRCENNPSCRTVLRNIFPDCKLEYPDLVGRKDPPTVTLYIAGVPCQSWSKQGLRLGAADQRGALWLDVLGYVTRQRPKLCIFENVPTLAQPQYDHMLEAIMPTSTMLDMTCGTR